MAASVVHYTFLVALLLLIVAFVVGYIPACCVMRMDPMIALPYE